MITETRPTNEPRLKQVLLFRPLLANLQTIRLQPELLSEIAGVSSLSRKILFWSQLDDRLPITGSQRYWQLDYPHQQSEAGALIVIPGHREPFEWVLVGSLLASHALDTLPTSIATAEDRLAAFCKALLQSEFFHSSSHWTRPRFLFIEHHNSLKQQPAPSRDRNNLQSVIAATLAQLGCPLTTYTWRAPALLPEGVIVAAGPAHFGLGDLWINVPYRRMPKKFECDLLLPSKLQRFAHWTTIAHEWIPFVSNELDHAMRNCAKLLQTFPGSENDARREAVERSRNYSSWLPDWLELYHKIARSLEHLKTRSLTALSSQRSGVRAMPFDNTHFPMNTVFDGIQAELEDLFEGLEDDLNMNNRYVLAIGGHVSQSVALALGEDNLKTQDALLRLTRVLTILTFILLGLTALLALDSLTASQLIKNILQFFSSAFLQRCCA